MSKSTTGRQMLEALEKRVAALEAQVNKDPDQIRAELRRVLDNLRDTNKKILSDTDA